MKLNRRDILAGSVGGLSAMLLQAGVGRNLLGASLAPSPADANAFTGKWTYRSFNSIPDPSAAIEKLVFGIGELAFEQSDLGQFRARLAFETDVLQLRGTIDYGTLATVRFQGVGIEGDAKSDKWVYDYLGFLAPHWPNGIDQRPAIVGTIVRTLPHSGGKAKAGVVNCWIAVKQD